MTGLHAKIDYILKHNAVLQILYKVVVSFIFRCAGLFVKVDDQLVLFSGHGRKYNDSPRVIYEQMRIDPRCKNLRFVWSLDPNDTQVIEGATIVHADTLSYFLTALKAKYWVTCVNIERGLRFKKRSTLYLNTWHGTPIKTIGNAVNGRNDFDFSNIDFFLCAGDYERQIYERDFSVRPASIRMTGLPRNDRLYHATQQDVAAARERLDIKPGQRVILYAPTWRDSIDGGANYNIKPPVTMNRWKDVLGNDCVVFVRAHAYTTQLMGIEFDENVRNATGYEPVNDLLLASDILISDYSAILFDYCILERPMVCFAYDYEDYAKIRGMYLDITEELPGCVFEVERALLDHIQNMDMSAECVKTTRFKEKFLMAGGNATDMCIDYLMGDGK